MTNEIKKRLEEYYQTATPEQVIAEFKALGVELVVIPEFPEVEYCVEHVFSEVFDNQSQSWFENLEVRGENEDGGYSITTIGETLGAGSHEGVDNLQYAIAA